MLILPAADIDRFHHTAAVFTFVAAQLGHRRAAVGAGSAHGVGVPRLFRVLNITQFQLIFGLAGLIPGTGNQLISLGDPVEVAHRRLKGDDTGTLVFPVTGNLRLMDLYILEGLIPALLPEVLQMLPGLAGQL